VFLNWLNQPFSRAMWLLAFKLGCRTGETHNLDLRCLNIDHPVFEQVIDNHDVQIDPRIRDKPDTILIYGKFNAKTEIPNEDIPGPETSGEIRTDGNKRKQENGSVLPIDSELKTALIEWLLVRPSTEHKQASCHPLFATGSTNPSRITGQGTGKRLWRDDSYPDSIQWFAAEETLEECPTCGDDGRLVESNLTSTTKPGRRFRCRNCEQRHWRSIYWSNDPGENDTEQRVTYHQGRHTFSSAHNPQNTDLHDGAIPKAIRTKAIRGDSNQQGDTEDKVYIEDKYRDFEADVREPYLDAIYKFGVYDNPIPAVGEGWEQ
jgi:integrase